MPRVTKYVKRMVDFYGKGRHKYVYKAAKRTAKPAKKGERLVKEALSEIKKVKTRGIKRVPKRVGLSKGEKSRQYFHWLTGIRR